MLVQSFQDRAEIEPSPAENFDIGKVGLPKLVDPSCLIFKLVRRLKHDEGGSGDQIMVALHSAATSANRSEITGKPFFWRKR